MVVLDLPQMTI